MQVTKLEGNGVNGASASARVAFRYAMERKVFTERTRDAGVVRDFELEHMCAEFESSKRA